MEKKNSMSCDFLENAFYEKVHIFELTKKLVLMQIQEIIRNKKMKNSFEGKESWRQKGKTDDAGT